MAWGYFQIFEDTVIYMYMEYSKKCLKTLGIIDSSHYISGYA